MIGQRIILYRLLKDMSVMELSQTTHIPLRLLQKVEQNKYPYLSVQYIEKIASALDISIQQLIKPETKKTNQLNDVIEDMESRISRK